MDKYFRNFKQAGDYYIPFGTGVQPRIRGIQAMGTDTSFDWVFLLII